MASGSGTRQRGHGAAGARQKAIDAELAYALGRDAATAARALLGAVLRSTNGGRTASGRIVETEAYLGPVDPASHAAARIGRTARNRPMFGLAGAAYVYRIYGVHRCFNVVTGPEGFPAAVLVRALEPLDGLDAMSARRAGSKALCSGPGRLAAALAIDEALNGHDLRALPLQLIACPWVPDSAVGVSGRIGVSRAASWPLRYYLKGNPHVSPVRAPRVRRSPDYEAAILAAGPPSFEEH